MMSSKTKFIFLFFVQLTGFFSYGQDPEPYVDKSFLIIVSTKNITEAYSVAKDAAQKTGIEFRDKKLQANKTIGATFPEDTCKASGDEFPCYYPRGRYDDGTYLSIEYSDAYTSFKKGFFIVIAANGNRDELNSVLKKVKPFYPQSYIKATKVYIGCMH